MIVISVAHFDEKKAEVLIVSTSSIGSYMLMVGTNAYIGDENNIYNPFTMAELQKAGLLVTIKLESLAYLAFYLASCCLSVVIQYFIYKM